MTSGLYVHPQGGTGHDNNTKLILHPGTNEYRLQFHFVGNQLQHVSTGKFVHPYGGAKGNDASLCLYDGNDNERTSTFAVSAGDGTLRIAGGNGFFVHPRGGNPHSGPDTELVWYHGGGDAGDTAKCAFSFIPAV